MIPKIHGVGRLGKDVELRYSKDGKAVAKTSLAFSEQEEVLWLELVAFGKMAEMINQYFKKGDRIEVEGKININEWLDKNNNKRKNIQLIVERVGFIEKAGAAKTPTKPQPKQKPVQKEIPEIDIEDDDIPF